MHGRIPAKEKYHGRHDHDRWARHAAEKAEGSGRRRAMSTQYVMVPVPEELVEKVQFFLFWNVDAPKIGQRSSDALKRLIPETNEVERELLVAVSEAMLRGEQVLLADAAATLGCSEYEVLGMMVDLNNRLRLRGGTGFMIMPIRAPGDSEIDADAPWLIVMPIEVATGVVKTTRDRV
jgi:hypothetical protein